MRAEILFPHSSVNAMIGMRGPKFRELTKRIARLPEDDPDAMGYALMMIRLNQCLDCNPDRFKALMGCSACAKRTIYSYKGADDALVLAYKKARAEVDEYLEGEGALEQAA